MLLDLVEERRVEDELALKRPGLTRGVVEAAHVLTTEDVHLLHEIGRTATRAQTRHQLQHDAVEPVGECALLPLGLVRMLLALVEQQGLHHIVGDRLAGHVQVLVAHGLEYGEALASYATRQQLVLRIRERNDPRVALAAATTTTAAAATAAAAAVVAA